MGVTNTFARANDLLAERLRFRVQGEATEFRQLLDRCGWERFEHAVALTELWAKPTATGAQKYARLVDLMKLVSPQKADGTKYRNAAVEKAVQTNAALDRELAEKIGREP